uniref:Fibronectin type-III domain-containing protein n=1 Tax=Malurus cyaneus samueli TaxID=2593467 RepID=A0A8C5U2K0_9PASS
MGRKKGWLCQEKGTGALVKQEIEMEKALISPIPTAQEGQEESSQGTEPQWDSRLQLAPDKEYYKKNEEVMLSCPEGFQPPFTHVKCGSEVQSIIHGKPIYRDVWSRKDSRGSWVRIRSSMVCRDVLQVDRDTLEVSSTSIKLNWTCRFPDACQGIRAMCRLSVPSSPSCEAEEVNGEQTLHGQEGTFTCSPLQPFTEYSVTMEFSPNTTLFSWVFRTGEAVPDKVEELWLDPDSGSLRWKALSSCKGKIIGYELSITVRNAGDSSAMETELRRLDGSVTEYRLPERSPAGSYAVTIRGLTRAGAGPALMKEFQASTPARLFPPQSWPADTSFHCPHCPHPTDCRPCRGHHLIVAATQNSSVIKSICAGQLPFLNNSIYMAAHLNLTAPRDFVLGDGSRGFQYHNPALHPGWDYSAVLLLERPLPQVPSGGSCSLRVLPAGLGPSVCLGPGRMVSLGSLATAGSLGGPGWGPLLPGKVVLQEWAELCLVSPPTGTEAHLCLLQLLPW